MIGREVFKNPKILINIDQYVYNYTSFLQNHLVKVKSMFPYIEKKLKKGNYLITIITLLLNIFYGINGSNKFKKFIFNKKNSIKINNIKILNKASSYIKIK
ncbi:hypothetical protein GJT96_00200 [Enterobacteriaceae endosymbiont of Donacia piscatrix]|nr:tRNA-dihydrouridine synthase [Enterobacteriaceae endosymbiont of Donacia piscatrix]QJC34761.1 hypothetical protein GJT96_00200 [Enterobacteriaceae endosymbiont of Donacia piscatrix]